MYQIRVTGEIDCITAFYIPEDLEYFSFRVNKYELEVYRGDPVEVDLEMLLRESLNVPLIPQESFWEVVLWKSRQEKYGMAHTQEPVIEIDGIKYKRVIFIQPYFPVSCSPFSDTIILINEKRDIYILKEIFSIVIRE